MTGHKIQNQAVIAAMLSLAVCISCNKGEKLHYGKKSNSIRVKLFIPIIEDNMTDNKTYRNDGGTGNDWRLRKQLPENIGEVLHVWKIVTPLTDSGGLYKEMDAFRLKVNDDTCFQLNIYSEIWGDTISERTGKLFLYNSDGDNGININDAGIDSIAKKWGLIAIVRERK